MGGKEDYNKLILAGTLKRDFLTLYDRYKPDKIRTVLWLNQIRLLIPDR